MRQALHAEYTRYVSSCMKIYLNMAGNLQVNLHEELMQIRSQLVCEIACFCGQKYPQSPAKDSQAQAKMPATARNITHHRRQNYPLSKAKYPPLQAKILAIPGKNTRDCS